MKKVLIILPFLKNGDGTATAIMNYYDELIDNNWKVDFLVLEDKECIWKEKVISNGGNIISLNCHNKYSIDINKKIHQVISSGNYQIIHVNIPGHIALIALKEAKKSHIMIRIFHCHNPKNTLNLKSRISTMLYDSLCFRKANYFISCSNTAGESRFKQRDFYVLKNVIDENRFVYKDKKRMELRKQLKLDDKIVIGTVSRITKQKNPEFLIECFNEFKKIEPKAFLLWIGEGELKEKIKTKLEKKGLADDVFFLGKQNNVEDWYSVMDIFLLPSFFEGMGIVFLEAQSTGLTCFGSDKVPIETEITNLMHRIPLKKDSKYWAKEMQKYLNLNERTSRYQDFAKANYTHKSTAKDMLILYNNFMEEKY